MRDTTEAANAELVKGKISPVFLVDAEFLSGTAHLWSGIGNVTFNGFTYIGVGGLGGISAVTESNQIEAQNITISFSAIPAKYVMEAINEVRPNNKVRVWFGFLQDNGALVANPLQVYAGRMDVPTLDEAVPDAQITITVENPLVDLQRAPNRRYTNEDQKIDFPDDKGFEYVAGIQNWNGKWGRA